ncbi:NAD(P)-binding domain-containing protein [Alkalihalobacillus deserti]|uniref:NAD(P)-binding domain-containing protein n=1 Tax=Alkalihalobacillus deserti TaxID=2879466 RepID=UPI001D13C26B|nr:NAD(P)-binding domain-containing protein [Alkalihalobacillus deserti]
MKLIVGSGRLASMLLALLRKNNQIFLYGRNQETVTKLLEEFPYVKRGDKEVFSQVKDVFLCLPPGAYESFLTSNKNLFSSDVTFFHMATAFQEKDVKEIVGGKRVIPLKLAGHAAVVKKERKGVFVIPEHVRHERENIIKWFPTMNVEVAPEEDVLLANQLGTEAAITMVLNLKETLKQHDISPLIAKQTINQTVQGVITGYQTNDLGEFAKKIVEQLKEKGDKSNEDG